METFPAYWPKDETVHVPRDRYVPIEEYFRQRWNPSAKKLAKLKLVRALFPGEDDSPSNGHEKFEPTRKYRVAELNPGFAPGGVNQWERIKDAIEGTPGRDPRKKGWENDYKITGEDRDDNIGYQSVHMTTKDTNEFLVAIGKQIYPEFLVFVQKKA
jgi:hypothetical protein